MLDFVKNYVYERMDLTDYKNDLKNYKQNSQVVLESKKRFILQLWFCSKKMHNLIKNWKKRYNSKYHKNLVLFTNMISADDAREQNHRMMNLKDCEYQKKKTRIFCPVLNIRKKITN